ncbi:vascular endothelial growth factor receptor 1 isoform X2 [Ochlerotatus camptorhynchus]|uniref:vascular endothelial growth factor receptor 1 isoform X2 n=1 Tax=Ochlerotatus camptorhynchus TaxID=644619 RepID=UPI0031CF4040
MCQARNKMHNQCHTSWKMWQPSVIYLIIIVQTAGWWGLGHARPSDLEANEMYRDLLSQHGAPTIESFKPEVELEAGVSYEMTCTANEAIRWLNKRTDMEDIEPPLIVVDQFETNDTNKPFGIKLTIPAASANVVGRYYCIFESIDNSDPDVDLEDVEALYKATSTYIFVKDPSSPLVPVEHTVVFAQQYEDVVIPCKPSSKDGLVELVKDEQEMEIENYKYTESRGYVLRTYRIEDAGLYICRPRASPVEQELHFQMDVMESCELKLLMSGTNNKCKLGNARRLLPLLSTTSAIRGRDSSPPRFEISNDRPEAPPSSVVHRSLSKTTNARTSRTSRSSNSILNLSGELSTTTMTTTEKTEFTEQYTTEHGAEGFDRTTDASGGRGGSRNASSSSGVGSRMLGSSAGQVTTGKGSRLDPSASPSVSRPFGRPTSEYIQKPRIEVNDSQHIKEGDPIKMTCLLDVADGVKFDIKWKLPDKRLAVNNSRITISRLSSTPHPERSHYQLGRSVLTINEAVESDTGFYHCEVTDHNSHTNHKAEKIFVLKQADIGIIELYEDNKLEFINITHDRDIKIVIRYRSGVQPEFYWTRDDETEPLLANEKYSILEDNSKVTMTVKKANIFDTGVYTLHATNGKNYTTYSMKVFVRDKPLVTISPIHARPNQVVTFVCKALGYPTPTMRFAFIPCMGEPWRNCSQSLNKESATTYGKRLEESGKQSDIITTEEYEMRADTAGYVGCYARNGYGDDFVRADLLISDLDKPVVVNKVSPEDDATIGDEVTIKCAAVVYNHTNQIQFFRDDVLLSESDDGTVIESGYESYAYWRKLVIHSVGKEHEGLIRCQVPLVGSVVADYDEMSLMVYQPIAPSIMEGNDHVELELAIGERYTFTCTVEGMPKPTIEWVKNGEPVIFDNDTIVLLPNGSLHMPSVKTEHSGEYKCQATNKVNQTEKVWDLRVFTIRRTWIYLILSLFLGLIIAVVLISIFYYRKKKEVKAMKEAGLVNFEEGNLEQMNPEISLDEQADLLPYKSEYEFPKERLKLGKQLGAGAFGVVMKATAAGIMVNEDETIVAVKMVKKQTDNEVMRALISELKIMVHLGQHLNVVNLLGAVTKNIAKRELMVIVEYCRFGNVQNFLLKHRPYFIDQVNTETGEIDSSIDTNQLRWSAAPYTYNSQGLKYVNLSFSTHNVNNPNLNNNNHHNVHNNNNNQPHQRRTAHPPVVIYCNNMVNSGNSAAYTNPKNHMNSKGYVRHSGIQNMAVVDSCNTEATIMTSVEGEELNTTNTANSNEPLWRSNYGMDYKGPARSVTTTDLVCWASQVASGMEYLASRKVLHGDLAARNILLCDDNVVKICDFGLARSMYKSENYKKKGEAPLPFKWLALECISDNVFGTYSDVWAYGIVLWEFFSLGRVPYPGMEANQELYNKLRDGYRMDKPQYANQDIYDIMLNCWNVKPDSRPSFKDLKSRFNAMLPEELRNHYIDLNEPYLTMNAEKEERGEPDYLASLGPPEEQAPKAPPNYVNGIILPLPPISDNPDYLQMTSAKSDSEDSPFDFASFNNSQPSPTLKNNLDSSPQQASKQHKKKGIPEEIPMLHNRSRSGGHDINSDSETEPTSPVPKERTTKLIHQDHEYTNVKRLNRPTTSNGQQQTNDPGKDAFSNPGYVVVPVDNEKRLN